MSFFPGDIVIVEHTPQNNPTITKARPALIISLSEFHNNNLDVIILPITSVVRIDEPTDIIINNNESYFSQTGLKVTSSIRCGSICAFPKQKVKRRIGTVPQEILKQAVECVTGLLVDCS